MINYFPYNNSELIVKKPRTSAMIKFGGIILSSEIAAEFPHSCIVSVVDFSTPLLPPRAVVFEIQILASMLLAAAARFTSCAVVIPLNCKAPPRLFTRPAAAYLLRLVPPPPSRLLGGLQVLHRPAQGEKR